MRGGAAVGFAVGCILLALLIVGAARPHSRASGRWGYILEHGRLGIVRASRPMAAAYPAWQFGGARIVIGRKSNVWPSASSAAMSIGTVTTNMRAMWLPLAAPLGLAAVVTIALGVLSRKRRGEGGCGACGYDLAGLQSGRCPECGSVAGGAAGG
jgi:hypothetical protein